MKLTYSHCIKATRGQLDRYPHTDYVRKTVDAKMWRYPAAIEIGETADTFAVEVNGQLFESGDTKEDAIHEACYWLMNNSRQEAYARAEPIVPSIDQLGALVAERLDDSESVLGTFLAIV